MIMSLNETPSAERVNIAFFGRTNAGKSSVINALCSQEVSIVSELKGTTTDPVKKAMELLPIGPVLIIDTPGLDDFGEIGDLRVKKSYEVMRRTDVAVVVIDSSVGKSSEDDDLIAELQKREIPYVIAWNKCDIKKPLGELLENEVLFSAKEKLGVEELKESIVKLLKNKGEEKRLVADLIEEGSFVILVVPIDSSAPKGRLILPQQQTIRDIIDQKAIAVVCQPSELEGVLLKLGKAVSLVITDSQAFKTVQEIVPRDIMLTSFSILFARYKGELESNVQGAKALDTLYDGAKILISEGCTHHTQCDDIGTVKIPKWIREYSGREIVFDKTSGNDFKEDLSQYHLIVHCGACMLNEKEMKFRLKTAKEQGIPMTNYGMAIAKMNGILDRSLEIFDGKY